MLPSEKMKEIFLNEFLQTIGEVLQLDDWIVGHLDDVTVEPLHE